MKDRSPSGSHRASGKSAVDKTGSDRGNPQLGIGFLYRELWRFADGRRSTLMWAVLLLIGSQGFKLAVPALAGTALNTLQAQGLAGLSQAAQMVALVFLATLASWLMHGPGRILERNVALVVRQRVSTDLMERLYAAPLAWHETQHGVETAHRVQQTTRALYDFAQSQFIYLQSVVRLVGPVVALWLISPWVGVVAVVGYLVLAAIIVAFDKVMMRLAREENAADREYWASLSDGLVNVLSVLALRLQRGWMPSLRRSVVPSSTTRASGPRLICSTACCGSFCCRSTSGCRCRAWCRPGRRCRLPLMQPPVLRAVPRPLQTVRLKACASATCSWCTNMRCRPAA